MKKLTLVLIGLLLVSSLALADDYGTYGPNWVIRTRQSGKSGIYFLYYKDKTHDKLDLRLPRQPKTTNKKGYNAAAWKESYDCLWGKGKYANRQIEYNVYNAIKICYQAITIFPWNAQPWKNLASQLYYIGQMEIGDRAKANYDHLLKEGYIWENMNAAWLQQKVASSK